MTDEFTASVTFTRKDIEEGLGKMPDEQWEEFSSKVDWDWLLREIIDWGEWWEKIAKRVADLTHHHKIKMVKEAKPRIINVTSYTEEELQQRIDGYISAGYKVVEE